MIMSAKTKVTKTKTALKQETYNLSDLPVKHDLHCGFRVVELVELGGGLAGGGLAGSLSNQHHRLQ